jgi:misacylated tRNA(Ala) deacylase
MSITEELFRKDSYLKDCEATVVGVNDKGGILLDRTVFYPTGGGQPGDTGVLRLEDGREVRIATTVKGDGEENVVHVPAEGQAAPPAGATVTAAIDWDRRYSHMRMHTALHLMCAIVPYGVTGNQIGADKSRIDFDIADATLDKDALTETLNRLVAEDHATEIDSITDEELDARPELIPTMSVTPPRGTGRVRLMRIKDVDLQPCGGTHVARTGEIGPLRVTKIENKGKHNRRVNIAFDG